MTMAPAAVRPRVSAGAVFFDADSRLLLVDPTYKEFWNLPGGGVDHGETPRAACIREVREELSLQPPIGALLATAWATRPGAEPQIYFVFDGGVLDAAHQAAITVDGHELREHRFVAVAEARAMVPPWQADLLTEVLAARRDGTHRYVELT